MVGVRMADMRRMNHKVVRGSRVIDELPEPLTSLSQTVQEIRLWVQEGADGMEDAVREVKQGEGSPVLGTLHVLHDPLARTLILSNINY
mmetsp:Transcript_12003/g.31545  ORF Transcript_12003/g.31545 Transcript_12003/m.31545 type:complete len:89 (+) Transcript_12003:974-1240(+)